MVIHMLRSIVDGENFPRLILISDALSALVAKDTKLAKPSKSSGS